MISFRFGVVNPITFKLAMFPFGIVSRKNLKNVNSIKFLTQKIKVFSATYSIS